MIAARLRAIAMKLVMMSARPARDWSSLATLVVVAPHPDDETLGCAAAIAEALLHDGEVHVIVAADGAKATAGGNAGPTELRRARSIELLSAMAVLGVHQENVLELALPDGQVSSHHVELVQNIRQVVREAQAPCRVLVTCGADPHPDHRAAAHAAHVATRGVSGAEVWEYPIWLWADWPISRRFGAGRELVLWLGIVVRRSARKLPVTPSKRLALSHYRSQLGSEAEAGLPRDIVTRALKGPELYFQPPAPGSSRGQGFSGRGDPGSSST